MKSPFFSVIIPNFNRANRVKKAINSILNQTFQDFEIIVVDDASTDDSVFQISQIEDLRINLIKQLTNNERGAARNIGLENAKGDYICFLDSDDYYLQHHLETFYFNLQKSNFPNGLWFTNTLIESSGQLSERNYTAFDPSNKFSYLLRSTFSPCRVCISKEIAKNYRFDEGIPGLEDLDYWLRVATKYNIYQILDYTTIYVDHNDSYTNSTLQHFEKELIFFKQIFKKPELKGSLKCTDKKFLLAKCRYFLSIYFNETGQKGKCVKNAILSFLYFPKGYNTNSNKTLLVNVLYNLPLLGLLLKKSYRFIKTRN